MTASIFRAKCLTILMRDSFGSRVVKVIVDVAVQPL
jgi:hypothetical protein